MESFVNAWLDDENKRAYTRMDIYPKDCPNDVFNRWEDFTIAKENIPSGEGDVTPFTNLLWDLVGGEHGFSWRMAAKDRVWWSELEDKFATC